MSIRQTQSPAQAIHPTADASGIDLLRVPLLRRMLRSRYMPLSLQVLALILFGWVIYDGFWGSQVRLENFATLGVWFLFFWPVILLSLVFLGRAWCAVCPIGTITAAVGRWSRGWPFPKNLRNISLSLFFFFTVLWVLRPVLGLSDSPQFTAWFFTVWAVVALVIGFLYVSRAFCRFVCPIAAPLSVIARVAPVALRAAVLGRMSPACAQCKGKECYKGSTTVQGCPVGEFPAIMESNAERIFCLKCLKSCPTEGALQIRLRWPFSELAHVKKPRLLDGLTVILLSSIFLWHMAMGHASRSPQFFHVWSQGISNLFPTAGQDDIHYLLTLACLVAAMGSLFTAMAFITSRLAGLRFTKSLAISGYAFLALVVFRALGFMSGGIIANFGDFINYIASLFGIHVYYPSAVVDWASRPLIPNTGYNLISVLYTVPLVLGLFLACYLIYRTWQRFQGLPHTPLAVATPAMVLMVVIVAAYEWAYLVGYRVIPKEWYP